MILEIAIASTMLYLSGSFGRRLKKILSLLPKELQNKNSETAIKEIYSYCNKKKIIKEQIAYLLATAWHESRMGNSMEEFSSGAQYEGRKDLGNTQPGDGVRFKGRGFVQLTGRTNYTYWGKRLVLDLINKPDLAKNIKHATIILVDGILEGKFTGKKLSDYINDTKKDYLNARRTINGTDQADKIKSYTEKLLTVL